MRIEHLKASYDLNVRYVHYPLHPETPAEGQTLDKLFAGRGIDVQASQERLAGLAAKEGLPWGTRTHTYNSRLAQELGAWADRLGKPALHEALFRAYFVEGANLADTEELVRIAVSVGLPTGEAQAVLAERRFRRAVDRDWERSRLLRIPGVPAFRASEDIVVGAQPYEVLRELVEKAGATRKTPPPR